MNEKCPMTNPNRWPNIYYGSDIPDVCREQCGEIWDALDDGKPTEDSDCSPECEMAETESYGEALTASSVSGREYTTFDQCVKCHGNAGGTVYQFECSHI